MEVTALYIRLFTSVLMLASATGQNKYASVFPRITPNRQQFFQYESVYIDCHNFNNLTEWRVMRKLKELSPAKASTWETSTRSRTIKAAYQTDSGEYWCEDKEGKRSKSVHITVTVGAVILDIPAVPVHEGSDVSLRCQKEKTSNITAQFHKDGFYVHSGVNGELTIPSVSKSSEGMYKCNISGVGESAESWLSVKTHDEEHLSAPAPAPAPMWICISVLCVGQLLLVMGLLYCGKLAHTENKTQAIKEVNSRVAYTIMANQRSEKEPDVTRTLLLEESIMFSSVHYGSVQTETLP